MAIKLSYSKISTYIDCPRKFFLSYIANLGTGSSPHMSNGSAIHKCCEDFELFDSEEAVSEILEQKFSEIFETPERSYENLIEYYQKILPKIDTENLVHEKNGNEIIINPTFEVKAHKALMTFFIDYTENSFDSANNKKGMGPKRESIEPKIKLQEQWFNLKLEGGHEVRGLIDRVDEEPEGEHIVDYKSGQTRITFKALTDPLDIKAMQLSIYALARYKETGKIPYKSSFFYLEPLKNNKTQKGEYRTGQEFTKENLEKVERFLVDIANEIDEATKTKNFPMGDNPNCYWCDFNKKCDIISDQQLIEWEQGNLENKLEVKEESSSGEVKIQLDTSIWDD